MAFFAARFSTAFFPATLFTAGCFFAAGGAAFFVLFLAAFGAALRVADPLFAAALDAFFLLGALTGAAAFEAVRFLPVGFVLPEDTFLLEAWTVWAFLLLLGPELLDSAALFIARCDIQVPL